jgi:MFS family permease
LVPADPAKLPSRYRAHLALGMLLLVYAFNFIDRIMFGILVPPIKHEFLLTDTELGLLGGTAFALFYTALGIPIGWLADRLNRVWIVTIALALWSAFTAACGAAHNFAQLFAARLGVGIGEAGGVAPAYALISDYFPPTRRARALAVYSFGIPLGSAAGILFGGLIAARVNWRAAFVIVGAAGLILAPLFRLCVREPVRGGLDEPSLLATPSAAKAGAAALAAPRLREVAQLLAGKPSFWYLSLGAASASVMGYGVYFWMPSFLVRSYHLSLPQVSVCFSALTFVSGVAGIWLGGALADRFGSTRRAAYAFVPAIAFLLSVPLYAAALLAPAFMGSLPIFVLPMALALAWLAPTASAIQHLVPPGMRALAAALLLFIINLIGLGAGSYAIGALSDHFATARGTESLRYAMLAGSGFYLLAAALYALGARRLAGDWHR